MKSKKSRIRNVIIIIIAVTVIIYIMLSLSVANKPRIAKREVGTDMYVLEEEVRNVLGQESVAISTNRSSGSGILWNYDGEELLVVTAGHLLAEFELGEMELWSGEKLCFSKEDVQLYPEEDMALIKLLSEETQQVLSTEGTEQDGAESYSAVESLRQVQGGAAAYISAQQLQLGDAVWVVDSVYGPASGINSCQVYAVDYYLEDYGAEMLMLSGSGSAGMSGCPVYDVEGRLTAMMSGMSEDGSILAAVPIGRIVSNMANITAQ